MVNPDRKAEQKVALPMPPISISSALCRRGALYAALAVAAGLQAGCASVPPEGDADAYRAYIEANDPLEPFNRGVFAVNQGLDFWIIRPLAVTYRDLVPDPAKDAIRNFLDNLRAPVIAANALLQGNVEAAGDTTGRFLINTVAGVGGLFDVARDIPAHDEDFGQTLGVWNVGEGPYLVLPVIGPSSPRDTAGLVVDYFLDPVNWWAANTDRDWIPLTRTAVRGVDIRSRNLDALDAIERTSLDFYATVRSLYRQRRAAQIRNGEAEPTPLPSITFDSDETPDRGAQPGNR
jgi:phospholipid-binding lipoprotein MlaA